VPGSVDVSYVIKPKRARLSKVSSRPSFACTKLHDWLVAPRFRYTTLSFGNAYGPPEPGAAGHLVRSGIGSQVSVLLPDKMR
jgi:hypothetical protein